MEDNQIKILYIAVGVLFSLLVIGLIALGMNFGKDTFERGMGDLSDKMSSVEKAKYAMFDNKEVRGSDVISFIETSKSMDITAMTMTADNAGSLSAAGYLRPFKITDKDCKTNGYVKGAWEKENKDEGYNTNLRLAKKNGSKFFIKPSGRYFSCLVVDDQMKPVGIAVEEIKFKADGQMEDPGLNSFEWKKAQ